MILRAIILALMAFPANAGLWQDVIDHPTGGCVRVPERIACLSACAFAWLKGSQRVNDGVLGFHLPWSMDTGDAGVGIRVATRNYLALHGALHLWPDIARTTKRRFLVIEGETMWFADWRALVEYNVTSDPATLEKC